jgi:hypothetical protein
LSGSCSDTVQEQIGNDRARRVIRNLIEARFGHLPVECSTCLEHADSDTLDRYALNVWEIFE